MLSDPEPSTIFRFYGSLNDFLPRRLRQRNLVYPFHQGQTLKDAVEAIGVPHPEVQLILRDGKPTTFRRVLKIGERIAVYPFFNRLEVTSNILANRKTHQTLKFMLDVHLGKLAKYMRFAGLDTLLFPSLSDSEIVELGTRENRIILTRDIGLLKHKKVRFGYWLRSQDAEEQFSEVIKHFSIGRRDIDPWKRCSVCNSFIIKVPKQKINSDLKPQTRQFYTEFFQCTGCGRVYWKGSHYKRLNAWIENFFSEPDE